ncbi:MAG TPA: hypothetical protein VNK94_08340 [Gaiellaceae bacterium]|nr:hypothetical protein [Gaiellaceae bacterium]
MSIRSPRPSGPVTVWVGVHTARRGVHVALTCEAEQALEMGWERTARKRSRAWSATAALRSGSKRRRSVSG